MQHHLRKRVPGGTYFFTARLRDRDSTLLVDEVGRLRHAMRQTKTRYPFTIDAVVILPSVIHTIWTLPAHDDDYRNRWAMVKSIFARDLPAPQFPGSPQIKRCEKGIWQRRFWDHVIVNPEDKATHAKFIHDAPVQAGLVARPQDWPFSSIHREIALGRVIPPEDATGHAIQSPQVAMIEPLLRRAI